LSNSRDDNRLYGTGLDKPEETKQTVAERAFMEVEVPSPCRARCKLNSKKICEGCFRTSSDISFWVTMDNEQKTLSVENAQMREAHFLKTGEYLKSLND